MDCVNDSRLSKRSMSIKDIVRLILRSAVETGTPFTFNRDTVNRANPNAHRGIIYCSNLCTEIAQNMSSIETVSTEICTEDGDTVVVKTIRPGDFVVCNLASLSLGHLPLEDEKQMKEKVATVVRALDNVIELNFYPIPFAQITNHRYRSIGLGVSGYHHALAVRGIRWESEEHLSFMDKVFERINYAAIAASSELAKEKGAYHYFEGSDWQTGAYFIKRGYNSRMESIGCKGFHTRNEKCLSSCHCPHQQHQYHCRNHCRNRSGNETFLLGRKERSHAATCCTGIVR